jgi:hypothetical protein
MALEKERLALKELYFPKFQKAVPAMKTVRYFQIESKIQAIVQSELAGSLPLVQWRTELCSRRDAFAPAA